MREADRRRPGYTTRDRAGLSIAASSSERETAV
jgi:hypothetical protein